MIVCDMAVGIQCRVGLQALSGIEIWCLDQV